MADNYSDEEIADYIYKRLTSPFALAEHYILRSLDQLQDEHIVKRIKEAKEGRQEIYWLSITKNGVVESTEISENLEHGLRRLYAHVFTFLPHHIIERNKEELISFPEKNANIDWKELLNRFLSLEKHIDEAFTFVPAFYIEYARAIEFYNISRLLAINKTPFNDTIMSEGLTRFFERIRYYGKVYMEYCWKQYDKPPIQVNLLQIKHRIATLKFNIDQINKYGLPSTLPKLYREVESMKEIATEAMNGLLMSYELKEQQLDTELDIIEYQRKFLKESPKLPIPPPVLTILPQHRDAIYNALEPYVSTGLDALNLLLATAVVNESVVIKGRPANALTFVFRQAHEAKYISNSKSEIARWLVYWFKIERPAGIESLSYNSVYPDLTKNRKPSKKARIPYEP